MSDPKTQQRDTIDEKRMVAPGQDGKAVSDTRVMDDTVQNEIERDDEAPLTDEKSPSSR